MDRRTARSWLYLSVLVQYFSPGGVSRISPNHPLRCRCIHWQFNNSSKHPLTFPTPPRLTQRGFAACLWCWLLLSPRLRVRDLGTALPARPAHACLPTRAVGFSAACLRQKDKLFAARVVKACLVTATAGSHCCQATSRAQTYRCEISASTLDRNGSRRDGSRPPASG